MPQSQLPNLPVYKRHVCACVSVSVCVCVADLCGFCSKECIMFASAIFEICQQRDLWRNADDDAKVEDEDDVGLLLGPH